MGGGIGAALQAIADFLIDERCHACGRPVDASARLSPPRDAAAAALAAPLRLGRTRVGIDTHPLCRACCHGLHAAAAPTTIGTRRANGVIALVSGGTVSGAGAGCASPLEVWPAFVTDDRVLSVVHALKFARHERIAPWLARALAHGLPARAVSGRDHRAVIVPVPMDRASLRRRGFNQAERLATAFGARVGVPVERSALVKTRAIAPQSSLNGAERVRNVAGVMAVSARAAVVGRRVVLVDDLVTTGATAAACAAALWGAGAREVRVACVGYRP